MLFLFTDNAPQVAITAPGSGNHRNSSTGPTPDCSPPSPDTALKNIVKVIRPQVSDHHEYPLVLFILKASYDTFILQGCCHYTHMNRTKADKQNTKYFLYLGSNLDSRRQNIL